MVQIDRLPDNKPGTSSITPGKYNAVIDSAEMKVSNTSGTEYLNVKFKLDSGAIVFEGFFDSDKAFLQYKLGRLIRATKLDIEGEFTLKDLIKVIKGKKVILDIDVNDRGYGCIDFSTGREGLYPIESPVSSVKETKEEVTEDDKAIEAAISTDDEDF